METIAVTYTCDHGNWLAVSADMRLKFGQALIAGGASYAQAREQVTTAIPWSLERDDVEITHCIEEASIPAYLAELTAAVRSPAA